jgi:CRP-like cAMP-binding protein
MGVVTTNILFSSYTKDEHNAIVDAFDCREVGKEVFVIRQGEPGEHFYVVQSGTLEIFVKSKTGEETRVGSTLGPGSCFGELALMYNTPRAASIKSTSDCVLWEIDRATYRGILVYYKYLRNKQYTEFLRNVEIMDKKLGTIMSEGNPCHR